MPEDGVRAGDLLARARLRPHASREPQATFLMGTPPIDACGVTMRIWF
jgi:hypothetical protein